MKRAADAAADLAQAMERLLERSGAEASSRFVRVDGRRIHYLEAGSGPAVVLVHGAGGGAANWFRQLPDFAAHNRVLAIDLPGFGLSDTFPLDAPVGETVAEAVRAWLDAVGVEHCTMVGTSLGGLLALRLAQRAPERVRRLVLLDSAGLGRELPLILRAAGLPGATRLFMREPRRSAIAWWFRWYLTSDRTRLDERDEEALVDYLFESMRARDREWMQRGTRMFGSLRGQREVLGDRELAGLEMPVLILWGERDRIFPTRHARRAADTIPRARLELLPTAGHSPNWEVPGAVLDRIRPFITEAAPDAA